MQELEKIIEKMKEIKDGNRKEKLYAKYPPNSKDQEVLNAYSQGYEDGTDNFYNATAGIIRKHMNDGWITVEERLPEEGQEVWISVKTDCVRRGMYTKCFGFGMREGFICSDGFVDINAVNAWKLYIMPEPYCPEAKAPEERQKWKDRMLKNFMKKGEM